MNGNALESLPLIELAYVDGGTGSLLFQIALSGVLGVAFVYRSAWAKLKGAIKTRVRPS